MMKRVLAIFFLLLLTSCSKKEKQQDLLDWMRSDGTVKVMSTTAMISDIVEQVGGPLVSSICLVVGEIDPHSYELVKGDDEKFGNAHLIFYNGVGLEHGATVLCQLENNANAIALGNKVFEKFPERFLEVEGQIDPHIWMDMSLFSEIIDPIVEALSTKDPKNSDEYARRGKQVKERLQQKDCALRETMKLIPDKNRFLVTSHDAFGYFTKRYLALEDPENWKKRVRAPEGLAPEGQMSILDIQKVTDFVCANKVSILFPETNMNRIPLEKIISVCRKKGLEVQMAEIPLYGDSMAGANTYIEMMEHNVQTFFNYMSRSF